MHIKLYDPKPTFRHVSAMEAFKTVLTAKYDVICKVEPCDFCAGGNLASLFTQMIKTKTQNKRQKPGSSWFYQRRL